MQRGTKRVRTVKSGACSQCVARKQRCYVGVHGAPCSTCRKLNIDCDSIANNELERKTCIPTGIHCTEGLFQSQIQRNAESQLSLSWEGIRTEVSANDPLENYVSIAHQLLGRDLHQTPAHANLPAFLSELPNSLTPTQLQYLQDEGVMCLPTPSFRGQLLESYILWVHPELPVVDLEFFLGAIAQNDGTSRISLLLFYAVMFAASAFVDHSYIYQEGYVSREDVRDAFFRSTKAILDLDCEENDRAKVQAMLMLAHWHDLPPMEFSSDHWMRLCIPLAVSISTDDSVSSLSHHSSDQQTWRRTAWCIHNYYRLKGTQLLSTTCTKLNIDECLLLNVPTISATDFKFCILSVDARSAANDCEVLSNIERQKAQADVFIQKTTLCQISHFSSIVRTVNMAVNGDTDPKTHDETPGASPSEEREKLHRWLFQLPASTSLQYPQTLFPTEWERSMLLHRAWFRLLYLGSAYAVCCDESEARDAAVGSMTASHTETGGRYIAEMMEVFDEVDSLNLSRQLPCLSAALLILALSYQRRVLGIGKHHQLTTCARFQHKCVNLLRKLKATSHMARCVSLDRGQTSSADLLAKLSLIP